MHSLCAKPLLYNKKPVGPGPFPTTPAAPALPTISSTHTEASKSVPKPAGSNVFLLLWP